jgi:uncharacterized membrane protein
LTIAKLNAFLRVSKKYASRKDSKILNRRIALVSIATVAVSIICGWVAYYMDTLSKTCEKYSDTFYQLALTSKIFMAIQVLLFLIVSFHSINLLVKRWIKIKNIER